MKLERIDCFVFRAPIETPLASSIGAMTNRPALFLRVTDSDGAQGWGEVFCNFPQVGVEHRARLVDSLVAPLAQGAPLDDPRHLHGLLETRLRRLAIQSGEFGPFAQITSALDQASWDLHARRQGKPLWRVLAGETNKNARPNNKVRAYASGLGPDEVGELAEQKMAEGFRAFKLKVGFGTARDTANFETLRETVGDDLPVMVDANQAWEPGTAAARIAELACFKPHWVEEPLAADEPLAVWKRLADETGAALAAGENIRGLPDFEAAIANGHLKFVQPDVAKWGGITGGLEVGRYAARNEVVYCPHWLSGGIGLAASMHLRAALGPNGFIEVDANPNPMRELVWGPLNLKDGCVELGEAPGLGVTPDLEQLARYKVDYRRD